MTERRLFRKCKVAMEDVRCGEGGWELNLTCREDMLFCTTLSYGRRCEKCCLWTSLRRSRTLWLSIGVGEQNTVPTAQYFSTARLQIGERLSLY